MESLDSLVKAAQDGEDGVFECIVERFQDMACAVAYALIEDVQLAEDVAQEAFLEAYLNLAKLREPAAFSSWFRRIIFKQADRLTRGKRLATSPLEEAANMLMADGDPTEVAEANEISEQIQCAIATLPERERMVIILFYGTGHYAAMTIATHFADAGREVLLVIDDHLAIQETIVELRRFATAKSVASIAFISMNDTSRSTNANVSNAFDVQLEFSQARAQQKLWPAIDPVTSYSRLLESDVVTTEHRQVAQQVREVLQQYNELQRSAESKTISEEDQRLLARGERINLFFTQPFVVAEAYTDLPGTYLTIEETINSFRNLLAGRYDLTPVQTFNFVGSIESK